MFISKAKIKYIRFLRQKKYREKYNEYVIEGEKIVDLAIELGQKINMLVASPEWIDKQGLKVENVSTELYIAKKEQIQSFSGFSTAQEVLAVCPITAISKPGANQQIAGGILYLEDIRDPGNLGTIIRCADWFGIQRILLSPGCVDWYNPKVIQSSMGSHFSIRHEVVTLDQVAQDWKGKIPVFAAAMAGSPLHKFAPIGKDWMLLIGNESRGLSDGALELSDEQLHIEGAKQKNAESLNAAVATAIFCFTLRQEVLQ